MENENSPTKNAITGFIIAIIVTISIMIGLLIPIPSPLEEETPKQIHKVPTRVAPLPPSKILIDLNEDDIPEWYYFFPVNEGEDE